MISRDDVVAKARDWLGTPYSHQGRVKGHRVDCMGLVVGICDEYGISHNAPTAYVADPKGMQLLTGCEAWLVSREEKKAVYGAVGVFWGWNRNEAQHFAIFGMHAHRLTMIHAFSRNNKVIEHTFDPFWEKRLVRVFDFPGVEPLKV